MKRIFSVILAALVLFSLTACGGKSSGDAAYPAPGGVDENYYGSFDGYKGEEMPTVIQKDINSLKFILQ